MEDILIIVISLIFGAFLGTLIFRLALNWWRNREVLYVMVEEGDYKLINTTYGYIVTFKGNTIYTNSYDLSFREYTKLVNISNRPEHIDKVIKEIINNNDGRYSKIRGTGKLTIYDEETSLLCAIYNHGDIYRIVFEHDGVFYLSDNEALPLRYKFL